MDAEVEPLVATLQGNVWNERGDLLWGCSGCILWEMLNLSGSDEEQHVCGEGQPTANFHMCGTVSKLITQPSPVVNGGVRYSYETFIPAEIMGLREYSGGTF